MFCQLSRETFQTDEVIQFLRQLHRQRRKKVIVVWDRLNAHRSAAAWFEAQHPDWFTFEWLPTYAPELNPIETCWSHAKCHKMANSSPQDVDELETQVHMCLESTRQRESLLRSFFANARLQL